MDERDWLADRFQEHRTNLRAVAYRMLGSLAEADDAVQEAATAQPLRHQWRPEPRGMADHGRWAGVPGHAPLTKIAARATPGRARARPHREPRRRNPPGARGTPGRGGRSRAARGPRNAGSRRAAR